MPGGVLATSGEVGKASEEACGVLTVSNKIAPAAPKWRARGGKASRARRLENFWQHKPGAPGPSCEESARVRAKMAKIKPGLADSAVAAGGDGGRRRASRAGPHLRQYLRWAASTHCGAARSP